MLGEDLSMLTVPELLQLEQQLSMGSSRVQARKVTVRVAVGVFLFNPDSETPLNARESYCLWSLAHFTPHCLG
jgi:hypothetical protein